MVSREMVGIAIATVGLLLIPFGLFSDPKWWIAVVVLLFIGLVVHTTDRVVEFDKRHGPAPGPSGGFGLHTDQIPHAPKMGRSSRDSDDSSIGSDGGDGD
jgi:hypothetical protein